MGVSKNIFVGLFFLTLAIPGTLMVMGVEPKNVENRSLTGMPAWCADSIEDYTSQLSEYVADHLPLRDYSYSTTALFNWSTLNTSSKPELCIKGKQNWMFYSGEGTLDDATHRRSFTKAELDSIQKLVIDRATELRKQGIEYTLVVVPNKSTSLHEYLPSHYLQQGKETRLDQIRTLFVNNPRIRYIDLKKAMKDSIPLYYKTDTHWNPQGAHKAADEIAKRMIKSHKKIDFSIKDEPFSGDLAKMLGLENHLSEQVSVPYHHVKVQELQVEPYINADQHVYYQAGENLSNILVFHDSYGRGLFPYLPSYFKRSTFIWDAHINHEIIEKEKPNFVVHVIVERYLDRLLWP